MSTFLDFEATAVLPARNQSTGISMEFVSISKPSAGLREVESRSIHRAHCSCTGVASMDVSCHHIHRRGVIRGSQLGDLGRIVEALPKIERLTTVTAALMLVSNNHCYGQRLDQNPLVCNGTWAKFERVNGCSSPAILSFTFLGLVSRSSRGQFPCFEPIRERPA